MGKSEVGIDELSTSLRNVSVFIPGGGGAGVNVAQGDRWTQDTWKLCSDGQSLDDWKTAQVRIFIFVCYQCVCGCECDELYCIAYLLT
jgi:hypothetical protein